MYGMYKGTKGSKYEHVYCIASLVGISGVYGIFVLKVSYIYLNLPRLNIYYKNVLCIELNIKNSE